MPHKPVRICEECGRETAPKDVQVSGGRYLCPNCRPRRVGAYRPGARGSERVCENCGKTITGNEERIIHGRALCPECRAKES